MYRRSAGPSSCPVCEKPRSVFYAMTCVPTDHTVGGGWREFVYDGEVMRSPEQFHQKKVEYSRRTGEPLESLVDVSAGSRSDKRTRADEVRHDAYLRRKKLGFDDNTFRQYQAEQRRLQEPKVRVGWTG